MGDAVCFETTIFTSEEKDRVALGLLQERLRRRVASRGAVSLEDLQTMIATAMVDAKEEIRAASAAA